MKPNASQELFARERLLGYRPELLAAADIGFGGAGALANNALLNLGLSGIGRARIVDPDICEISNVTRSPLMKRERLVGGVRRFKAHEASLGFLAANAYAGEPVAFAAVDRFERLGPGAFMGTQALVSAVDRDTVRGFISDTGMLLGIPVIEAGFHGAVGQLTVFRHDDPTGACWRCLHPEVETGSASCTRYALAVQTEGRIPATQPVAALFGALVAHAVLAVLHGDFALASTMVTFDLARGTSRRILIDRNPSCLGPHRRLAPPVELGVGSSGRLGELFDELGAHGADPSIIPPSPFVVRLPCRSCGRALPVGRPELDVDLAPECKECPSSPKPGAPLAHAVLSRSQLPTSMRVTRLGFGPGSVFEVLFDDGRSGVFRLAGDALARFRRFERARRSTKARDDMEQ